MKFDFITEIKTKFTEEQIKEALNQALKQDGLVIKNIEFKTKEECTGYGYAEEYHTVFDGAYATLEKIENPSN